MTSADLITAVKKHPIGFACGFIALGCGVWSYFRSADIDARKTLFEEKSAEAAKMVANVRNSEKIAAQVEEIQSISKEVNERLIRPGRLADNLRYFFKLEAETGVKLNDVRQAGVTKAAPGKNPLFVPIGYTVSLQGSFVQIMQFVQRLESGPHFARFTNLSLGKSGGQGAEIDPAAGSEGMNATINLELLGQP